VVSQCSSASAHVRLVELEICDRSWTEGIGLYSANFCKIVNCVIHNNYGEGIGDWTVSTTRNGQCSTQVCGCSIYGNGYGLACHRPPRRTSPD
jgi:hypothetical protein